MNRIVVFVSVICFAALMLQCKGKKQAKSGSDLKDCKIEVRKTPCKGKCPVYTVSISSDGKAVYEGKMNVDKVGKYEKKLSEEKVKDLFQAFNNSGIWDMKDEYLFMGTDLPTTYVTYSADGKTKSIKDQKDAPEKLKELEKLVDDIIAEDGWSKVE